MIQIREYFALPQYIKLVTYVSLGNAMESVRAPGRINLKDVIGV